MCLLSSKSKKVEKYSNNPFVKDVIAAISQEISQAVNSVHVLNDTLSEHFVYKLEVRFRLSSIRVVTNNYTSIRYFRARDYRLENMNYSQRSLVRKVIANQIISIFKDKEQYPLLTAIKHKTGRSHTGTTWSLYTIYIKNPNYKPLTAW